MRAYRWPIAIVVIAFIAAIAGVYIGRTFIPERTPQGDDTGGFSFVAGVRTWF